jgi:hypothetical protein
MKTRFKQSGRTLAEMAVVIAAIVLLGSFGLPAVRTFLGSFESGTGARPIISAALASARAVAAKEQQYAGIRFQKVYEPTDPLKASQYMIFIVHDFDNTGLAPGFRAVEGMKPIKLPDSLGVMDFMVRIDRRPDRFGAENPADRPIVVDDFDDPVSLSDMASFSVVFSPTGKMVIHHVRVRNREGDYRPLNLNDSMDDIFNSPENITNFNTGMFIQDDYAELGFGVESSRNRFVIYDRNLFEKMNRAERFGYMNGLEVIYINPYTGTMIEK